MVAAGFRVAGVCRAGVVVIAHQRLTHYTGVHRNIQIRSHRSTVIAVAKGRDARSPRGRPFVIPRRVDHGQRRSRNKRKRQIVIQGIHFNTRGITQHKGSGFVVEAKTGVNIFNEQTAVCAGVIVGSQGQRGAGGNIQGAAGVNHKPVAVFVDNRPIADVDGFVFGIEQFDPFSGAVTDHFGVDHHFVNHHTLGRTGAAAQFEPVTDVLVVATGIDGVVEGFVHQPITIVIVSITQLDGIFAHIRVHGSAVGEIKVTVTIEVRLAGIDTGIGVLIQLGRQRQLQRKRNGQQRIRDVDDAVAIVIGSDVGNRIFGDTRWWIVGLCRQSPQIEQNVTLNVNDRRQAVTGHVAGGI